MTRTELRTAAPMPKSEETIAKNPMKLYAYLVCLAGVAAYPETTRMFRHKDLKLTKIKEATGITDRTVKLYMYELEWAGLIKYSGKCTFDYVQKGDYCEDGKMNAQYRPAVIKYASEVWKGRNKEKDSIYYIHRPNPYTPIPEITLEQLNKQFKVTELELKIYLLCCTYRDDCFYYGRNYKAITYEQLRDVLGYKLHANIDNEIRRALLFLRGVGLISYTTGYYPNSKGAKIPCFKINEVGYYINGDVGETNLMNEIIDKEELQSLQNRLNTGFSEIQLIENQKTVNFEEQKD